MNRWIALALLIAVAATAPAAEREKNTQFKIEAGRLALPSPILFKTASDELDEEPSAASLWLIADFMEAKPAITLGRIEGHVASGVKDSQELSEKRAASVGRWLIAHGVDVKRLVAVGFGSTKPLESDETPAAKAANTRIEFHPAALRGKLIGSAPADGGGKEIKIEAEK
jgi:outer membrane protein OmpA-like peptidoglycan-associated protein